MIRGTKYWEDIKRYYSQSNNVAEKINQNGLEYCGPTSAVMILDCMGNLDTEHYDKIGVQPEDELTLLFNTTNKSIKDKFLEYRPDMLSYKDPWNRIPQFYPYAIEKMFNKKCYYIGGNFNKKQYTSHKDLNKYIDIKKINLQAIKTFLNDGLGIQLCLKNPGHYISAIAYDFTKDEIIYNDPWPNRAGLKNKGKHERLSKEQFETNVNKWCIVYV